MKSLSPIALAFGILFFFLPSTSSATPEFAQRTGLKCGECHIDPAGGGALTEKGKKYLEQLREKQHYNPLSLVQRIVRLTAGYLHLMAAIAWFGSIIYVHLLLKPAYASKGLPRGELLLGGVSMIIVLITGILLTIARVPSLNTFYTTRFGILLGIKIVLFALMFLSVIVVVTIIGPRLRRQLKPAAAGNAGSYTPDELAMFNGKESSPAYVSYKNIVYDVSRSRLWKDGAHLRKHSAGQDLTELLKTAPHGEEKILSMPVAGLLLPATAPRKQPFHEKLFYFLAYMNFALTFIIVFIIALWRWW